MDSGSRKAVSDTGGKRPDIKSTATVEPGISINSGISTLLREFIDVYV
jgi:hypothetical protein